MRIQIDVSFEKLVPRFYRIADDRLEYHAFDVPYLYAAVFGQYTLSMQITTETTLSYASIMGLRTDTNLTGGQYNWLGSMFYFGSLPNFILPA
jgi:hypothetical protein